MLDVKNDDVGVVVCTIPKNFEKKRFRVFIGEVYSIFLFSVNGQRCMQIDSPHIRKTMRGVPSSFKSHPIEIRLSKSISIKLCAKKNAVPKMIIFAPKSYRVRRADGAALLPEIKDPSKVNKENIVT